MTNEKRTKKNLVKVSMNLPSHIIEKVKEFADFLGINVTSAYIILLNQGLRHNPILTFSEYEENIQPDDSDIQF